MPKSHTQKQCDKLLQELVRAKNTKCLLCHNPCEVGHHFIRKSLSSYLRYDLRNIIPLCNSCHCKHHLQEDPSFEIKIVDIMGRDWYNGLEVDRRKYNKVNVDFYNRTYDNLLKEYESL